MENTLIPFNKLVCDDIEPVRRVMESGEFILGENVSSFEREFAEYLGAGYCIGVASGTDAITLALMALGIRGEVIVPAFTAYPTIIGVLRAGARPVPVDVLASDGTLDWSQVKIGVHTEAIIPVHLYGNRCQINVDAIIRPRIIEDCAQYAGRGYVGDVAAHSFYPTKNLGACGDGGAVVTNNFNVAETVKYNRNYGQIVKHFYQEVGLNSRLDELQAAILRVKLKRLDEQNSRRREIAEIYRRKIDLPIMNQTDSLYHLFVIRHPDRTRLRQRLHEKGVETSVHYPYAVHKQRAYKMKGEYPVAEMLAREVLSLPMYPTLKNEEAEYIADMVNQCV